MTQKKNFMNENEISKIILDNAIYVHKKLGPGLLESTYDECLAHKLRENGLLVEQQVAVPVEFEGVKLNVGYRIDQRINKKVIVEIKAIEALNDIHVAQVLTYLKWSGCKLGLLLNFNNVLLKHGIKRIIKGTL